MTETSTKKSAGSPRRKQYTAPALEKGLDILELLSAEPGGLAISEITQYLGRSVGELFRMLVVLEQRGYVSLPPGSDKYTLTLKMFELSHQFPPVKRLTTTAGPIMQSLSYQIEQSCHLVIYYEGKGQVVVQQDSPSERMFSVRLGAKAPLADTCSGHVLLAFAGGETRKRMLGSIPSYHPKPTKKGLEKTIARVKNQGYESVDSAQTQGVHDIGFPIYDYTGQVLAALVVPFLAFLDGSHPIEISQAQELARQAAVDISKLLGYKPE